MSKRLRLGHAAVNRALPRRLAELHGFTPRRDPTLGFLCVSNLLGRGKNQRKKKRRNGSYSVRELRAAMSRTGGVCHLESLGDSCFVSPSPAPHALWLLDSALPLAEEAAEGTAPAIKVPDTAWQPRVCQNKCFFSAAASSTGGKDGDEPRAQPCCCDRALCLAPVPRGAAGCVLGSGRRVATVPAPRALGLPPSCAGAGGPPLCRWSAWSRGRAETGWLRTGGRPAAGRLGRIPALVRGGTGNASPLPRDIRLFVCLSVCRWAWSGALTGCQAIPLHAPRGLLVLEGKLWPFPPVSETRPASPRNKPLPKALASEKPSFAKPSAERQGDPLPLQPSTQQRRAARLEPAGRWRDPPRVWLASLHPPPRG